MSIEKNEEYEEGRAKDPGRRNFLRLGGLLVGSLFASNTIINAPAEVSRKLSPAVLAEFKKYLSLKKKYHTAALEYGQGRVSRDSLIKILEQSEISLKKVLSLLSKRYTSPQAQSFIARKKVSLREMREVTLPHVEKQRVGFDKFEGLKKKKSAFQDFLECFHASKEAYDEYRDECFLYLGLVGAYDEVVRKFQIYEAFLRKSIVLVEAHWDSDNAHFFVRRKKQELGEEALSLSNIERERLAIENWEALRVSRVNMVDYSQTVEAVLEG